MHGKYNNTQIHKSTNNFPPLKFRAKSSQSWNPSMLQTRLQLDAWLTGYFCHLDNDNDKDKYIDNDNNNDNDNDNDNDKHNFKDIQPTPSKNYLVTFETFDQTDEET